MKKDVIITFATIALIVFFVPMTSYAAARVHTGMYGLSAWGNIDEALDIVKKANIELVVLGPFKPHLDKAAERGLKAIVFFALTDETVHDEKKWQDFLKDLRDKITEFKDHPAVFAWYVVDEPDGRRMPLEKIKAIRSVVRSADKKTPMLTILNSPGRWGEYLPYFDIICIDPYLRKKLFGGYEKPEVVKVWLRKIKEELKTQNMDKPVWAVLGAFDTVPKDLSKESRYKKPTPEEFKEMIDVAVNEGVEGILVYTFAFRGAPKYFDWKLPKNDPILWQAVVDSLRAAGPTGK